MTVDDVKKALNEAEKKSLGSCSNKIWTTEINKEFTELGHKNGLEVYSKQKESDWSEWLYDVTICKTEPSTSFLSSAELVMESEWKTDDQSIKEDFQKLLLCNSKIKVMVFYKNEAIIPDLLKQIEHYENTNGTFILACYTDDRGYVFNVKDVQ